MPKPRLAATCLVLLLVVGITSLTQVARSASSLSGLQQKHHFDYSLQQVTAPWNLGKEAAYLPAPERTTDWYQD
eukprot:gene6934-6599_t